MPPVRSLLPKEVKGMALDHLESRRTILEARQHASGHPLHNEPPALIFSTRPALLVPVDGPAVYRPVEKTTLDRVLNTRALILREKAGKYYLHLFDGYLEASSLNGPWTICQKVPGDVKRAEKQAVERKQVDLLAGQANPNTRKLPSLKTEPVPDLHVTFVPTELIVTMGEPLWAPLPPTQLLYVTNTTAHIFKELNYQQTYVLISGRWFRSPSFGGPWESVPGANLPKDFAAIPFYERPYIELRGVAVRRYMGEHAASMELEARWQFGWRFSLVGFTGAGIAWTDFERFANQQVAVTAGVGWRYELARRYGLHLGMDVAFGPDDPTIYVVFGSAWFRP